MGSWIFPFYLLMLQYMMIQKFPESVKLICEAGTDEDAGMRKS